MSSLSSRASGAIRSARIGSSSLAIGTATAFIAIAAGLSFAADDGAARTPVAWGLRGSIASEPALRAPVTASHQQVARSDLD